MKPICLIILLVICCCLSKAQNKYIGNYYDYYGCRLELKNDSSFKFSWAYDMSSSWSTGTWSTKNDTIYFKIKFVFDTLRYYDSVKKIQIDTLVLSIADRPRIISKEEYAIDQIMSGNQNSYEMPPKLYYHKDKLYRIYVNGELVKLKFKSGISNKKHVSWYLKE